MGLRYVGSGMFSGYPTGVNAIGSIPWGRFSIDFRRGTLKAATQHVANPSAVAARIRWSIAMVASISA